MNPVRLTCKPRPEVLSGDLQDAIFAADFGHVVSGCAPRVYADPAEFFRNTHPAQALTRVVHDVFHCLTDDQEAGAIIRLSTGFGGGKTHTLIALWHLARSIGDPTMGTELLPPAGRPTKIAVAGVDGDKCGTDVVGRHDGLVTHSLWGELAYQLGGREGYARIEALDRPDNVPDAAAIREILPDEPTLILLDELVLYMAKLSPGSNDALLGFLNSLMSVVQGRRHAALVVTDPKGQAAFGAQQERLDEIIAQRFDELLSRRASDFDPIGDEAPKVIIRRLFESVDQNAANQASADYFAAYKRMLNDHSGCLPKEAATREYADRIVTCYPFHPRLIEAVQNRLGSLPSFQKSRGALRLFARILRDVWESDSKIALITAGDIDWSSSRIRGDLLSRLQRDQLTAAVDADVIDHAGQLDAEYNTDIHKRVASALLLESLPGGKSGMSKQELALATLRASEAGTEADEAMDRLMNVCWYTYPADESHQVFQFRYEPNVNKMVAERVSSIPREDARQRVRAQAQQYFGGSGMKLAAWPPSPKAVPESTALTLVLTESDQMAQRVCDYLDDSDPTCPMPRAFRNAIVAVAPNPEELEQAVQMACTLIAADQIRKERANDRAAQEQLSRLIDDTTRRFRIRVARAFSRLFFNGREPRSLSEAELASAESAVESADGQRNVLDYLKAQRLAFEYTEWVDPDLFVEAVVKGATPSLEHGGACSAKAVHERALRSDKLRLMGSDSVVRNSIFKAVEAGKLAVRLPTGEAYDQQGAVIGQPGDRHRCDLKLQGLTLSDDVLVAPMDAPCIADWFAVDDGRQEPDNDVDGPSKGPDRVRASSWDAAIEYAARRPLLTAKLTATTLANAEKLMAAAQPLSPNEMRMNLDASGDARDGGSISFSADRMRVDVAHKLLGLVKSILPAMTDGGQFGAVLNLEFGDGRRNLLPQLEQASQIATGIEIEATFGPEDGQ